MTVDFNPLYQAVTAVESAVRDTEAELSATTIERDDLQRRLDELEHPRRVLLGASTAPNTRHGTANKEAEAKWLEQRMWRQLDMTRHYNDQLTDSWVNQEVSSTVASGRIPVLSFRLGSYYMWRDVGAKDVNGNLTAQAKAIDALLRTRVSELMARTDPLWGKMILCFENEPESKDSRVPSQFKSAYNYIRNFARTNGLQNTWSTTLMETTMRDKGVAAFESWIPDCDKLGVHGYSVRVANMTPDLCATRGSNQRTFLDTFDGPHASAVKFNKPMMVFECGVAEDFSNPDRKANWFRAIPEVLPKLPLLEGICYWHSLFSSSPCTYEQSLRIDSTDKSLQGWIDASHTKILGG